MSEDEDTKKVDLDYILINEIGQFDRYQIRVLALAAIGVVFAAFHAEYVFTAARINTRCLIPECEDLSTAEFSTPWLEVAIPSTGAGLDDCNRFNTTDPGFGNADNGTCPADIFTNVVVPCDEYVYENQQTVVYDFDLGCDEWRRSLIGFTRTFGTFAALPITGYISDRWGRRTALGLNVFNTAWIGIVRYWAGTYIGFMMSQIIEAVFGSGLFSCSYIIMLELVGPKYRVIAGGILSSLFAIGQVFMGLIAWAVPDWRPLTLALYVPQLFTFWYVFLIPESVRWYMSKGRYEQSEALLKKAAKINRKELSETSLQLLRETVEEEKKKKCLDKVERANEPWLIVLVFKHKNILLRCLVVPVCWVAMTLIYYGLSINAVNMSGNSYVNFILVSAVEIPGFWIAVALLNVIGRKPMLIGAYWICSACMVAYIFISSDIFWLSLTVYLIGKCAISGATTSLYVYTAELYPTRYRHNLFAYSSMIGRIGSIVAPLTPAIGASTFEELPFALFGGISLLAGLLLFLLPETLGTTLPDTIDEADHIGQRDK